MKLNQIASEYHKLSSKGHAPSKNVDSKGLTSSEEHAMRPTSCPHCGKAIKLEPHAEASESPNMKKQADKMGLE